MCNDTRLHIDDLLQSLDEPRVNLAGRVHLLVIDAEAKGLRNLENAIRRRSAERRANDVVVVALPQPFEFDVVEAGKASL